MWSRKEVKARGKEAMKANYILTVVVSLLMLVLMGGGYGSIAGTSRKNISDEVVGDNANISSVQDWKFYKELNEEQSAAIVAVLMAIVAAVMVISIIVSLLRILVFNPLTVGFQNFFLQNCEEPASFDAVGRGFSPSWGGNVLTMFLRGLYLFLWTLLFIIPGIIKAYSYALVPYIRADQPELGANDTITLSRHMMNGNKWKMFVFDLSFIGWLLLGVLTCGVLNVFYVNPYINCSRAELYRTIKAEYEENQ
ncbi:MAG: DUF975 family protein [Lachnospiraceae bacterium]|nr:DUF975 family protein [Lachnospiraceae bacterium]